MANKWEFKEGDVIGRLTILGRDYQTEEYRENVLGKKHRQYYKCRCECGNVVSIPRSSFTKKVQTLSCGCLQRERTGEAAKNKPEDLTGKVFQSMKVLHRDLSIGHKSGQHAKWVCECLKCGRKKSVRGIDLIKGTIVDCGCGFSARVGDKLARDLNGMKFGHLEVLGRDEAARKGGRHARWLCRCDICGEIESVASYMLLEYGKDRCRKCNKDTSSGELQIKELLNEAGIDFVYDMPYKDCLYPKTGGHLRFDFRVEGYEGDVYLIEYDGEQHFRAISTWAGETGYQERLLRDNYKNEWCRANGIPLIRIPYTHLPNICIEDLLPSQSSFVVA